MEQHPVPQNVTTFQFRLIGDMTLKQFGYLCAGGILAFISYKLPLPFFFTWPATVGFALLGIGFAFVPVEERPMDVWVFSFFKSIYSPTQYIWTQEAPKIPKPKVVPVAKPVAAPVTTTTHTATPSAPPQQNQNQNPNSHSILSGLFGQATQPTKTATSTPTQSHVIAHAPKPSFMAQLNTWMNPPKHTVATHQQTLPAAPTAPAPSVTGKHIETPVTVQHAAPSNADTARVQQEMTKLEGTVSQLKSELATRTMTDDRIVELQKQLTDLLSERSQMENELSKLRRTMIEQANAAPVSPPTQQEQHTTTQSQQPTISVINTQAAAIKSGLPRLTTTPNVITGIIKDNTNNFLPAILVTVTNRENIPMRALKTNKLGQFAASTPLPNDVYIIEAEDPRGRFTFDRVQITLNGAVVPAIEIVAKSQKQITREKLTQEIFGKNQL